MPTEPLKCGEERVNGSRFDGPSPALDPVAIDRLRDLTRQVDPAMLPIIFTGFLEDASVRLASLRDAADAASADRLWKAAHALRGASAELGARDMEKICQVLEELGRSQTVVGAKELLDSLEQAFGRVRVEIDAQLARGLS